MTLPTEPIGSIPRPQALIDGMQAAAAGSLSAEALEALYDDAVQDTLRRFEATGSPVITDGEQRKHSFLTYPIAGLTNLAPGGVTIPFEDGHTRQLPVITSGPFRYATQAWAYLDAAGLATSVPLKQAVISASALSLLYPGDGIDGYPRDAFVEDLVSQAADELRGILARGATAQIDFTEGRLSLKLDPSGGLLNAFVDLNNQVLDRLTDEERSRVGVHTCPGGDQDSTHSADVDYAGFLPSLFRHHVDRFFVELAGEADRPRVLGDPGWPRDRQPPGVRRRRRPDRRPRGDAGRGRRSNPGGGPVHRPGAPRDDRRLRLLAVRGRHVDLARRRVREDPGPRRGQRDRVRPSGRLGTASRRRRRGATPPRTSASRGR